jgi:predicted Zn-dependent protease
VHATTAVTFQMMGSHDLARRHLEKAIALNPNDIWIVRSAGFISAYLGDFAEARNWTTRYLRLDPHFPDGVREMLFDVYFMTGRYEDAVAAFQGWPNPPPHMYCELAAAHAHLGKLDRARAAISQFERVRPANYDGPKVAHVHARMCRRQEDTDRWLEGYRMAGLPV